MIQITVAQTTVRDLKGTSKTTGRPYHMRFQTGYAHTVDKDGNKAPYPEKVDIKLDESQDPYQPGEYTLHPSSLYVDRDNNLAVGLRLVPIKARAAA